MILFFCLPCIHPPINNTVRGSRPGKNVQLSESEIKSLCMKSREIFLSQPILLELEAPLKICGECHHYCGLIWKKTYLSAKPLLYC